MPKRHGLAGVILAAVLLVGGATVGSGGASTGEVKRHLVVFAGDYAVDSTYAVGGGYAVLCNYAVSSGYAVANGYAVDCAYAVGDDYAVDQDYAVAHDYAVSLVQSGGGTVVSDLLAQIGVLVVDTPNALFADVMRTYAVVQEVGNDFASGGVPDGGPAESTDPLESQQWGMTQISAPEAHAVQAGSPHVDVGILDTGIDGNHVDFLENPADPHAGRNVDCARGRNSITFVQDGGPGVGVTDPCVDNHVHGTHVAGIVAAQANGVGVVGVAPNVTLVPIKVCDSSGHCYASAVVDGITYAGDAKLDVINMSFFVDDDEFQQSTELKCLDDPKQRAFRTAVERALRYARAQGVVSVAALGNSDRDLGSSKGNECEVVPAESEGVIGTAALVNTAGKASYSNYGDGATDVAAPGGSGTGRPNTAVLSTTPGNTHTALTGTSMAAPHTAGVAALIVSQFGKLGPDGDVKMAPATVEQILQGTVVDQGIAGYDECFGHGRVNALRAVTNDTSGQYDAAAPFCPEYDE